MGSLFSQVLPVPQLRDIVEGAFYAPERPTDKFSPFLVCLWMISRTAWIATVVDLFGVNLNLLVFIHFVL